MRVNCIRSEACDKSVKNLLTEGGWGLIFSRNHSSQPMKKILLSSLAAAAFAVGSNAHALIASDNAGNYSSGWTNGANGGTGFLAWSLSSGGGTGGFGGNFIGDPTAAGITGFGTQAFGQFANPSGSGAFANADRAFSSAMSVGDTFSFQWAVNFDSGDGNKGFNLYSGGVAGTQLLNVNQGGFPGNITLGGSDTGIAYGTGPMTWSFTLQTPTSLLVTSSARNGTSTPVFSTNLTVAGAPDAFRFYASNLEAGNNRQPYFNNLSVVPEPSTYALLGLSALALGGYVARRRARK
jgi:PEP-CTERM motif